MEKSSKSSLKKNVSNMKTKLAINFLKTILHLAENRARAGRVNIMKCRNASNFQPLQNMEYSKTIAFLLE